MQHHTDGTPSYSNPQSAIRNPQFQPQIARIESLVGTIEGVADPAVRATAQELVQALLDLQGAGLERVMEHLAATGAEELIDRLADDDLVGSLLLLHGLHPVDCETRVRRALDKVRPYLGSHGGDVELLGFEEGVVRLRLNGSCNGCASSAMTLKLAIEDAIYEAAPEVTALDVAGVVEQPGSSGFVPLSRVRGDADAPRPPHSNGANSPATIQSVSWQAVDDLAGLDPRDVRALDVAGQPIAFCRVNGTFYAYGNRCPHCDQTLDHAHLEAAVLVCATCGHRYDVQRAGQGLEDPYDHLEPFPLLAEQGRIKVALPVHRG